MLPLYYFIHLFLFFSQIINTTIIATIHNTTNPTLTNFGNNLNPALFTSISEAIKMLSVDIMGLTNPVEILNILLGEEVYTVGQEEAALKALHVMFPNLSQDTTEFIDQLNQMSEAAQKASHKINSASRELNGLSNSEDLAK